MQAQPVYKSLRAIEKQARWPVAVICAYEALAIVIGQPDLPTVSQLASRHRYAAAASATLLGLHIWFYDG